MYQGQETRDNATYLGIFQGGLKLEKMQMRMCMELVVRARNAECWNVLRES